MSQGSQKGLRMTGRGFARLRGADGWWFLAPALLGLVVLLLVMLVLQRPPWSAHSLDRVQQRGELRIGYAPEPPYALLRADGTPTGEGPIVAAEVARQLGLEPVWILTSFDRLIPELEARRFDVVAAGLFVTPARARRVRFSRPTLRVRQGWLQAAGAAAMPPSYAQAQPSAQHPIAVIEGSVEMAYFQPRAGADGLLVLPDAQAAAAAVAAGQAQALALSLPAVRALAAGSDGRLVARAGNSVGASLVALALHRDDTELAAAVDGVLAGYIGSAEHVAALASVGLSAKDLPDADAPRD